MRARSTKGSRISRRANSNGKLVLKGTTGSVKAYYGMRRRMMVSGMTPMVVLCVTRHGQDSGPRLQARSRPDDRAVERLPRYWKWARRLSKYAPVRSGLCVCCRWLRGPATTFTEQPFVGLRELNH